MDWGQGPDRLICSSQLGLVKCLPADLLTVSDAVQAELDASKGALTALSEALLSEQTLTGMQVEQIASAHPPEARPEVSKFQHAPQNGSNGATFSQDLMRAGSAQ